MVQLKKNVFVFGWCMSLTFTSVGQVVEIRNTATAELSLGITEVSLLKISTTIISLQLKQQEAGLPLEKSTSDSTARLLISSVVSVQPRMMSARISEGRVPSGTRLELLALQPNVNFVGYAGTYAPPIILDETDKIFVTDIMTSYSGTDLSDGYPLKFIFSIDDDVSSYGLLRATTNTSVTVTITLTETQ